MSLSRFLAPLAGAALLGLAPALAITPGKHPAPGDTVAPTPEALLPVIMLGFARSNCALNLDTGQQQLAEAIAPMLGTTADALRERGGVWYRSMDNAFDLLDDTGRSVIDRDAGTITIANCMQ